LVALLEMQHFLLLCLPLLHELVAQLLNRLLLLLPLQGQRVNQLLSTKEPAQDGTIGTVNTGVFSVHHRPPVPVIGTAAVLLLRRGMRWTRVTTMLLLLLLLWVAHPFALCVGYVPPWFRWFR
jgi:hypothetical protein